MRPHPSPVANCDRHFSYACISSFCGAALFLDTETLDRCALREIARLLVNLPTERHPEAEVAELHIIGLCLAAKNERQLEGVTLPSAWNHALLMKSEHKFRKEPLLLPLLGIDQLLKLGVVIRDWLERTLDCVEHLDRAVGALEEPIAELAGSNRTKLALH